MGKEDIRREGSRSKGPESPGEVGLTWRTSGATEGLGAGDGTVSPDLLCATCFLCPLLGWGPAGELKSTSKDPSPNPLLGEGGEYIDW